MDRSGGKSDRKRQRQDPWDEDYDRGKVRENLCHFYPYRVTVVFSTVNVRFSTCHLRSRQGLGFANSRNVSSLTLYIPLVIVTEFPLTISEQYRADKS